MPGEQEVLLEVENLVKTYPAEEGGFLAGLLGGGGQQRVPALNGVSFRLEEGQILGLIGESGSGKSALARVISGEEKPDSGRVTFMGKLVSSMGENDLKAIKRNLRYLPEDAFSNLTPSPKNRVDNLLYGLAEQHMAKTGGTGGSTRGIANEMLSEVGLGQEYLTRFPSQMSGGERQRLAIARALMLRPKLIVADEPVSNLDLNNRTAMLDLMRRVGRQHKIAFIFISHNPSLVRYFAGSGRVSVMFAGRFMEGLAARNLFEQATHPYTKTLLSVNSLPSPLPASALDPAAARAEREQAEADALALTTLESEMSAEGNISAMAQVAATSVGCPFYRWCPERFERCTQVTPKLLTVEFRREAATADSPIVPLDSVDPTHQAACLRYINQRD